MSVRTLKTETGTSYYCTFTCYNWLPIFEITNLYDAIYKWFDHLKKNGHQIIGYVIMPNHTHCIIHINKEGPVINKIIGNGKRFLAYEIIERLQIGKVDDMLDFLHGSVSEKEIRKGVKHKVFEPSFDGKECYTYEFLQEKLRYIHFNPVKAGLVQYPEEYIHSSAKFYFTNEQGVYPVTHFIEVYEGKEALALVNGAKNDV